eukprot:TRINITY_DN569_c2_g1_i2.p1 TRINITY_DN569_c2_g1~~TRINITY_DN569_c2_g1_i2.p1  ORF type:complete len:1280 (+),score=352.61 TRINITY_DN569_c2_g1_i2:118-3840(+)
MSAAEENDWCGKKMRHLRLTSERPALAYGIACTSFCLLFFMWVALIIAAPGFFEFSTDVPLYLRGDKQKEYRDAVEAGQRDAKYSPANISVNLPRSVSVDEKGDDLVVEIIYEPEDVGDIYEIRNLQAIRDIDESVMQLPFWRRYCLLDWSLRALPAAQEYEAAVISGELDRINQYKSQEFLDRMPCTTPRSVMWGCLCPDGTHLSVENGVAHCQASGTSWPLTGCDVSLKWTKDVEEQMLDPSRNTPRRPDPFKPENHSIPGFPPGLLNCKRPGGCQGLGNSNALFEELDQTYVQQAISYYSQSNPHTDWSTYRFVFDSTDSAFGGGTTVGTALRSQFFLGLPIDGFASKDEDQEQQVDKIADAVFDDVHGLLFGSDFRVKVWFDGPLLLDRYIATQITADGMWALGSMVFVWLYIVFMNGSWFLGTMGMGQILMAFAPAYMLYFIIGFRYFGTFNVLTIFIILGIGADDIFVFLDTWKQSEMDFPVLHHAEDVSDEERRRLDTDRRFRRMSWTWKRAAKAMLVTSATTMASFLCTGTSSFPGIQTFGIFAAMLVLCNYLAVIFYYPTVVAYNDVTCVASYGCCYGTFCCSLAGRMKKAGAWINMKAKIFQEADSKWAAAAENRENSDRKRAGVTTYQKTIQVDVSPARESRAEHDDQDGAKLRGIELFFYKQYAPFIIHYRWVVTVMMLVFVAVMCVFMAKLESDPDPPKLFPSSNNYGGFRDTKAKHFARGGNVYSLKLRIVSGLNPDGPIDRSGTKVTDPDDIGRPVWSAWDGPAQIRQKDMQWDNFYPDLIHEGVPCFEHLCDQAVQRHDERKVGGLPEYPIQCWVTAFRKWVQANDSTLEFQPTATWEQITGKVDGVDYDGDGQPDGAAYWSRDMQRWVPSPKADRYTTRELFWQNVVRWLTPQETFGYWDKYLYGQLDDICYSRPLCSANIAGGGRCCADANDRSCHCENAPAFRFAFAEMTLTATSRVTFEDGLDLVERWENWLLDTMKSPVCQHTCRGGMGNTADPPCATPAFITDPEFFAFFKVQEVMVREAFQGIGISLALAFFVIAVATMNVIMALVATVIIGFIVICVIGVTVTIGWKLGIVQAIVFVMVPGMAVDYVAHLTEAYTEAHVTKRNDRVRLMLTEVGISVISGAFSTLGASLFLFAPVIIFFNNFGTFMFCTISISLVMSLLLFPALMAIFGPEGTTGSFKHLIFKSNNSVAPTLDIPEGVDAKSPDSMDQPPKTENAQ